jgi:hypothetical protein
MGLYRLVRQHDHHRDHSLPALQEEGLDIEERAAWLPVYER